MELPFRMFSGFDNAMEANRPRNIGSHGGGVSS